MNNYIKHCINVLVLALGLILTSCSTEDFDFSSDVASGSKVRISLYCTEMLENFIDPSEVGTRASDKLAIETVIRSVDIFLFDKNGEFLTGSYRNSMPYIHTDNSFYEASLDGLNGLDNVRIVALANIDGADKKEDNKFDVILPNGQRLIGGIENGTRGKGNPYTIRNLQDLLDWTYAPRIRMEDPESDITGLPSAGMPMYYMEPTYHNLTQITGNLEIPMTAMMARVDVSVKLEPKATNMAKTLPRLTITSFGIRNMPTTIKPFKTPGGTSEDDCTDADIYVDENGSREIEFSYGKTIDNVNQGPITFSYYTYENVRLPNYDAKHPDGKPFFTNGQISYPAGLPADSVKQRWKSNIARTEEASALVMKGVYTTDQNLTYNAQFTVYLGQNPNDNFMVERNHQYTNKILIKGLDYIRNSDDNVWNFDGRVNVVDDNPFYLAIINERKVDAHATALPMDVWLMYRETGDGTSEAVFDHTSKVKVKILEGKDWIKMVMVPRKVMADAKFAPGTGIEPYFTTDLFTRINNKSIIAGKDGWQCGDEVEIVSTKDVNNSRSRIYFYIDENVPESNDDTNYGDRVARIQVIYDTDKDGGDHRERILEIEQRALVKVKGTHPSGDVGVKWMEYYEEFLEHSDPLDQHLAPGEYYTEGLPWGQNISYSDLISSTRTNIYDNYNDGYLITKDIVTHSKTANLSSVTLYNSTAPESAFHYCYGKNKRTDVGGNTAVNKSDDGRTVGWYMPGIRELESALTEHYLTFKEFQNNFYWSAAAGKKTQGLIIKTHSEVKERARATKVIQTDPVDYASSGGNDEDNFISNDGSKGRALRSQALRIRAFYQVKEK